MNKKLLVYPFDVHFCPILRYPQFLEGYEIAHFVSPRGFGLVGKDAGHADGGKDIGITVEASFEEALSDCDAVLFTESDAPFSVDQFILPKLQKAVEALKEIICTIQLTKEQHEKAEALCKEQAVGFSYCHATKKDDRYQSLIPYDTAIAKINTPVIFVMGIGECTNKFQTQLALRQELQKLGYRVSQAGSRSYCELLGFHSFPGFMSESISEMQKILMYNRFIKRIENEESPDVILIGVPGGLFSFNDELTNNFGVYAFELTQAVVPDGVVLNLLFDDLEPAYLESVSTAVKNKFGCFVDAYHLSNMKLDWMRSKDMQIITHIKIEEQIYQKQFMECRNAGYPMFNALTKVGAEKLAGHMVNQLSGSDENEAASF